MPKETIRSEGFDVEVTWGRDQCHVQVATVIQPPKAPTRTQPTPSGPIETESPASLGTLVASWSDEEKHTARGLHATLARRHDVNELIRVLRRARDQAFGRDE